MMKKTVGVAVIAWMGLVSKTLLAAQQDGFVPVDSQPPTEQLPAAPLLIMAYAFV